MKRKYVIAFFFIILFISPLFCQKNVIEKPVVERAFEVERKPDNNHLYHFPFSLGVMYKSYSALASYGRSFRIQDINGQLHWPLPNLPFLQPTLTGGVWFFDSQDTTNPEQWDHFHAYGLLGLTYAHRFSKNFELGLSLAGGLSEAYFTHLLPEAQTLGSGNVLFELGGRIGLSPTYNLNIDINPSLRYLYSLSPLKDFDGLMLGIGLAMHFRFGEDPDLSHHIRHYLTINPVISSPLFALMQSYYVEHPLGKVNIVNTHKYPLTDLEVAFFQAGYMDSPTVCATIPELKGGESRELNLVASFNEEIFKTEGVIPLTGEIRINYSALGKRSQQTASIGYDLYDKRALIWDDDRKIAALITPADSSLRNYVSFIHQISKNKTWSVLNTSLQGGTQLYNALSALGCVYQPDPQLPFNKARVTANMNTSPTETKPPAANAPTVDLIASAYKIDTVNLPRETLKQITGDCDDLTVLYCALLETMGIESGFITTPGHIFPAFNTKLPARQYAKLHPDRQFSININGELWIPVEITKLGQKTFLQAWERGAKEWYIWEEKPENRNFYATSEAQKVYRPVGLKETDLGLQYGSKQEIIRLCETDILQVTETVCSYHEQQAAKSGLAEDYNKLGIVYSEFGLYAQAEAAFQKVLQIDAQYLIAKINLGHLAFYQKHYEQAVKVYLEVLQWLENNRNESSPYLLNINLCLSAVYNELKDSYNTRLFYEKARQIDAKKAEQMAYVNANDGTQEGAAVTKERSQDYLATRVGLLFRYQESVFQD